MGATNFALKNAKRYFIIEEPEEADYWFWTDAKECLADKAIEHGFEWIEDDELCKDIESRSSIYNSYCASVLPCFIESKFTDKFGNTWKATLIPLVRYGYYAHANLDYYIELLDGSGYVFTDGDVTDIKVQNDNIMDYCYYLRDYEHTEMSAGDGTELLQQIDTIVAEVTDKFYQWAEDSGVDEYAKAWQCDNGEDGYTNLSEIKRKAKEVA